jgi:hypothetical protein
MSDFEEKFFLGEVNQFLGSGGEILVKGSANRKSAVSVVEVGDRFVGIGITHTVETLSRPPGPETFRAFNLGPGNDMKGAMRAFQVAAKNRVGDGFEFELAPLSPADYSELISSVTGAGKNRVGKNSGRDNDP